MASFYIFSFASTTIIAFFTCSLFVTLSDPEAVVEEEAGRDLGQEEDRGAHLNLYVWIRQTPVGTRQL